MKNEFGNTLYCELYGKICYTLREASEVVGSSKRHVHCGHKSAKKRMSKYTPQRKYYCKACGYYHLTHRKHSHEAKVYIYEEIHMLHDTYIKAS